MKTNNFTSIFPKFLGSVSTNSSNWFLSNKMFYATFLKILVKNTLQDLLLGHSVPNFNKII